MYIKNLVGATRIELAASRPPDVRATTALSPDLFAHYNICDELINVFSFKKYFDNKKGPAQVPDHWFVATWPLSGGHLGVSDFFFFGGLYHTGTPAR